ncbi:MAG: hypothetical protein ACFFH0_03710, partial [Promethearchaeota archaeon]
MPQQINPVILISGVQNRWKVERTNMSFLRRKGPSFKVEKIESLLQDSTVLEFAGSGDPHEEYGKVRLLLENLKACPPDILL